MKKSIISLGILLLFVAITFAQNSLDAYKYIIVPDKFDEFKEADKYQLNSLTNFLFKKYGFQTLSGNMGSYPSDIIKNPCLAVTAKLNDHSSMFTTKVNIDLIDCYNKVVYSSEIGKSKIKEYKPSYQEALRSSFITFEEIDYAYNSNLVIKIDQTNSNPVKIKETVAVEAAPVSIKKVAPEKESVPTVALVPAAPVVTKSVKSENIKANNSIAKSYKNAKMSFMLIDQDNKLAAYVKSSSNKNYEVGEMIGTFIKTSLPNGYRVTWKNQDGKFEETTGYIDDSGNLKVDINRDGTIEVVTFEVEK